MGQVVAWKAEGAYWQVPSLEERADLAEKHGVDSLLYCRHPWALRHQFVNRETGEVVRARCNRWECLYCGPRKVDQWRQLVKAAEPVLFLTLTKAGKTIEQAKRALTTFIQALRRGSKGKGPNRVGARAAYLIEYFAVLERHRDFERNGFHWHLLIKGVDFIPYEEVIKPLWMSATHYNAETGEGAEIAWIERIRNARAIGYVTKYLTKSVSVGEKGTRQVERKRAVVVEDEQGELVLQEQTEMVEVVSKAHRIRYSRHFFPEKVADLRARLFEGLEQDAMEQAATPAESDETDNGLPLEEETHQQGSSWELVEREEAQVDVEEYKRQRYEELMKQLEEVRDSAPEEYRRRKRLLLAQVLQEAGQVVKEQYRQQKRRALLEALEDDRRLSRRVINTWTYQRQQLRLVC